MVRTQGSSPTAKFMWQDHDTDIVYKDPPVLNQWETVFDADDVRLLWCGIQQQNGDAATKDVEVRWTIDGKVYRGASTLDESIPRYVLRSYEPSVYVGLYFGANWSWYNACAYNDKRGHRFKVEVRLTSALGTAQVLLCWCVRETLEVT